MCYDPKQNISLFPKASEKQVHVLLQTDFPQVITIFSAGYFFIWLLLYFMHGQALHATKDPALDKNEIEYTRKERRGALWNAMVGVIAESTCDRLHARCFQQDIKTANVIS